MTAKGDVKDNGEGGEMVIEFAQTPAVSGA